MTRTIHQRDERYDPTHTLCLRRAGQTATTARELVTCPLCQSIADSRAKMDAEVADGTFWNRFSD